LKFILEDYLFAKFLNKNGGCALSN